jgi:hypothetical protein
MLLRSKTALLLLLVATDELLLLLLAGVSSSQGVGSRLEAGLVDAAVEVHDSISQDSTVQYISLVQHSAAGIDPHPRM